MSKLRFLFVLFSLIVLAAPGRAQDRDHGHGRGKSRGDAEHGRKDENRDRKAERDDENDDEDDDDRVEDRNRNGHGDDEDDDADDDEDRRGGNRGGCTDANGNNRCDVVNRSVSSSLPEMVNAVLISRGQLTRSGRNWLGGSSLTPRFIGSSNRAPRQVTWLDRRGAISQTWVDNNNDGRADVVRMYRKGKLVRTVRR